jgi:hypothetical protein
MGEVESHSLARQPIQRRRRRAAAVAAERIRAQRVDGDEENVLVGDRMQAGLRLARSSIPEDRERDDDNARGKGTTTEDTGTNGGNSPG